MTLNAKVSESLWQGGYSSVWKTNPNKYFLTSGERKVMSLKT